MNADERMMRDYDYHKNTGELPEYFSGGNSGCFTLFVIIGILVVFIWSAIGSCSRDRKNETQQEHTPLINTPTPTYEQPLYNPPTETERPTEQVEQPQQEEISTPVSPPIQSSVTISKYYEEGYDKGYDDGEDDAVSGNGWGGQFDDSNRYKGQKKKDYELGYEEGYEAGYDDNMSDDE